MGWIYLLFSIGFEISGTTLLKMSDGFTKLYPSIGSIISYVLCFYGLSLATKSIPMNTAYAVWSGVGIVVITIIGILVFKEKIDLISVLALLLIISGVVILKVRS